MEPQTNNVMDLRTFGRMFLGRQEGQRVTKEEFEADKKAYDYYVKQAIDKTMASPAPSSVQFGVATNSEGRVTDYAVVPDGVKLQVLEPKTLNTQQGMFTQVNPTNVAPIVDPRTGQQVMGYAADPVTGDVPQTIGAYGATPQQTPSPSPVPQTAQAPTPAAMPQANQSVRVVAPDGRTGIIPAAQVDQALKQGFRLAP